MAARRVDKMAISYILNPARPDFPSVRPLWSRWEAYNEFGRVRYPNAQQALETGFREGSEMGPSGEATAGEIMGKADSQGTSTEAVNGSPSRPSSSCESCALTVVPCTLLNFHRKSHPCKLGSRPIPSGFSSFARIVGTVGTIGVASIIETVVFINFTSKVRVVAGYAGSAGFNAIGDVIGLVGGISLIYDLVAFGIDRLFSRS